MKTTLRFLFSREGVRLWVAFTVSFGWVLLF